MVLPEEGEGTGGEGPVQSKVLGRDPGSRSRRARRGEPRASERARRGWYYNSEGPRERAIRFRLVIFSGL